MMVDEDVVDNEILVENHFEDAEDGQVDAKDLDVKTHLFNLDDQYADDLLH